MHIRSQVVITTHRLGGKGKLGIRRHLSEAQSCQSMNQSIIIEKLEGVDQDCLNDANLPAGVCNSTGRVGTHKSWTIAHAVSINRRSLQVIGRGFSDLPKANGNISCIHTVLCVMLLDLVKMLENNRVSPSCTHTNRCKLWWDILPIPLLSTWRSVHQEGC